MRYGIPTPMPFRGRALTSNQRNVDRLRAWVESARPAPRLPLPPRCFHYGAITDAELFRALSVFRGQAYRAGDATRRQQW